MRSNLFQIILGVVLTLASSLSAQTRDSLLHKPAPQFTRIDLDGKSVDLSAYRGRVVLLNFWATWCAPCQTEMPRFVEWQNHYQAAGLQVIGASMDDEAGQALEVVRKRHLNYPVIMGDSELGTLYGGVLGLPVTFLIDRQGRIAARFKGGASLPAMKREMKQLLRADGK